MNQPLELWDITARYHGGNPQSVAANAVTDKLHDRNRIMQFLATVEDATCDEVELALNMSHQTASARFSELKLQGLIMPTTTRATRSGAMARAYACKVRGDL